MARRRQKSEEDLRNQARSLSMEARRRGDNARNRRVRDIFMRYRDNIRATRQRQADMEEVRRLDQRYNNAVSRDARNLYGRQQGEAYRQAMNRPYPRSVYMGLNNG